MQNQFDTVKVVRSDNALEFRSGPIDDYFTHHGIVHQTSYVDRPQQNGRVERKPRHVLEIARALRFQAGLPLSFWSDCVMTAAYLINRLPSVVLDNKTPYELLFHEVPLYTNLKVFGWLAFASNPSRDGDKFQPKGIPCLFLGYPPTQKGYKLLNLHTKQTFVSRDARFYEAIFPYKLHNPHIIPSPPSSHNTSSLDI